MDYHFWFWVMVAFLAGRLFPRSIYIGTDKDKYSKADIGLLLRKKK